MNIRNSARAIIIQEGHILTIPTALPYGICHFLPGGGQDHGETLEEAVVRECEEELGLRVRAERLVYIREYIASTHPYAKDDAPLHQIDHIFYCVVQGQSDQKRQLDEGQCGIRWLPVDQLRDVLFFPEAIIDDLQSNALPNFRYLGNIL